MLPEIIARSGVAGAHQVSLQSPHTNVHVTICVHPAHTSHMGSCSLGCMSKKILQCAKLETQKQQAPQNIVYNQSGSQSLKVCPFPVHCMMLTKAPWIYASRLSFEIFAGLLRVYERHEQMTNNSEENSSEREMLSCWLRHVDPGRSNKTWNLQPVRDGRLRFNKHASRGLPVCSRVLLRLSVYLGGRDCKGDWN